MATDLSAAPAENSSNPPTGPNPAAPVVLLTDATVAFGILVGFNQLATQSPVDAILPVALIAVGVAGVLALLAALIGAATGAVTSTTNGNEPTHAGPLAPPALETGFAAFAVGVLAIGAVLWRWGVPAQAALVAVAGITLLLTAGRGLALLARRAEHRPDVYRFGLTAAEAVLFIGFAWAALADGSIRPFT